MKRIGPVCKVALPREMIAEYDRRAVEFGMSRAEVIRMVLSDEQRLRDRIAALEEEAESYRWSLSQ